MRRRDAADLLMLAALWGGAFLFLRLGAGQFGPFPLAFVRVAGASLLLVPLLVLRGDGAVLRQTLRRHWRSVLLVGIVNSALPFALFAAAALALGAALMSVFNATAPIWGALIAWLWLGDKLPLSRWLGLAVGVAGVAAVAGLAWGTADFKAGVQGADTAWAIAACLAAAMSYGLAANVSRRHLAGVPPMAVAAGSQCAATLVLAVPAMWTWPAAAPAAGGWASAAALAFLCTGVAYVLFFRLIANAGAANAISVTLLIPAFALLWGWLLLDEQPTGTMLAGCAIVLLGTALSTGLIGLPRVRPAPSGG